MSKIISKQILVVEDDHDIFEIVRLYLENAGFNVFHATNTKESLAYIEEQNINLIILGLQLPDANGFEICSTIRKSFDIPIIFLSGRTEENIVTQGLSLGANDYMFKPFIPNELIAKVRSYL